MRYSCTVCGMNHSRPCDLGLACGIYKGVPMQPVSHSLGSILFRLKTIVRSLWSPLS